MVIKIATVNRFVLHIVRRNIEHRAFSHNNTLNNCEERREFEWGNCRNNP